MSNAAFYYTNCYRTKVFKMKGAGEKMEKGTKKQRKILSKMMNEFQLVQSEKKMVENYEWYSLASGIHDDALVLVIMKDLIRTGERHSISRAA